MQQTRHILGRTLGNKADTRKQGCCCNKANISCHFVEVMLCWSPSWPLPNLVVSSSTASFCSCYRILTLTGTTERYFTLFVFKSSPPDTAPWLSPASSRAVPSVCCSGHLAQTESQKLSLLFSASATSSARSCSMTTSLYDLLLFCFSWDLYWEGQRVKKQGIFKLPPPCRIFRFCFCF